MSKTAVTVFLCAGKDCSKAWRRVCDGSPGKWLKHRVEEARLPYKLQVVKTECLDRCDEAACLCFVHGHAASLETQVRSSQEADRLLAALRACCEQHDAPTSRS
jgi:predicted metal-binding protein